MERIDFKNYPDESTPLSAENLNQLQANIEEGINEVNDNLTVGSGWIDLEFSSNFENYSGTASNNPQYRRIGKEVYLRGVATPAEDIPGSATEITMFNLPEGVRPSKDVPKICQGTGKNTWLLMVNTDGRVTFSRYGISGSVTAKNGNWLVFEINFTID